MYQSKRKAATPGAAGPLAMGTGTPDSRSAMVDADKEAADRGGPERPGAVPSSRLQRTGRILPANTERQQPAEAEKTKPWSMSARLRLLAQVCAVALVALAIGAVVLASWLSLTLVYPRIVEHVGLVLAAFVLIGLLYLGLPVLVEWEREHIPDGTPDAGPPSTIIVPLVVLLVIFLLGHACSSQPW